VARVEHTVQAVAGFQLQDNKWFAVLDHTAAVSGAGNGIKFKPTSLMLILFYPVSSPGTITVFGTEDQQLGRGDDHVTQSITNGQWAAWGPFTAHGFLQTDGYIWVECSTNSSIIVADISGWGKVNSG
jgi:hypothetical protein